MILHTIFDILAGLFLIAGLFFMLVGAVGIVRFPDAYNRLHASSKCSTLGLVGLLLGAIFHIGTLAVTTKALLTILFAFVATPVGSHILAKAAHIDKMKQWPGTLSDELAEDYPDREPDPHDDTVGIPPTLATSDESSATPDNGEMTEQDDSASAEELVSGSA